VAKAKFSTTASSQKWFSGVLWSPSSSVGKVSSVLLVWQYCHHWCFAVMYCYVWICRWKWLLVRIENSPATYWALTAMRVSSS